MTESSKRLALALALSAFLHAALLWYVPMKSYSPITHGTPELSLELMPVPGNTAQEAFHSGRASALPAESSARGSAHQRSPSGISSLPAEQTAAKPSPVVPLSPSASRESAKAEAEPGDLLARSLQMARQDAEGPFTGQRVLAISSRSTDALLAAYEEAYRQKVEQVGTVNYPPPVNGQHLYGSVRLRATLRPDGSLALLEILQSSGSSDLDHAAQQIVRMASPFQPFPEAMRQQADLVSITRTFTFTRAGEAIRSQ
jgi:protein TonB